MRTTTFGNATISTGANKGKDNTLAFSTGIKASDAAGLPVSKAGTATVEVNQASVSCQEFESADEIRQAAGAEFDTFVVTAANAILRRKVHAALVGAFKKVTLPAQNWNNLIGSVSVDPASLFAVSHKAVKLSRTNAILAIARGEGTAEERLARIEAQLAALGK